MQEKPFNPETPKCPCHQNQPGPLPRLSKCYFFISYVLKFWFLLLTEGNDGRRKKKDSYLCFPILLTNSKAFFWWRTEGKIRYCYWERCFNFCCLMYAFSCIYDVANLILVFSVRWNLLPFPSQWIVRCSGVFWSARAEIVGATSCFWLQKVLDLDQRRISRKPYCSDSRRQRSCHVRTHKCHCNSKNTEEIW